MKNAVIIKSFPNGITVYLDETVEFQALLEELELKFKESSKFFKNAKVALSLEGRVLSEDEERQIIFTICHFSQLTIVCLVGKDEQTNQVFLNAIEKIEEKQAEDLGRFYKGNLTNGEILESDASVIMIGDVQVGCSVISSKDIIILGSLYGEAYAGAGGETGHFIVALDMKPSKLKIGDYRSRSTVKPQKWGLKAKSVPQIAYVKEGQIIQSHITKDFLENLPI